MKIRNVVALGTLAALGLVSALFLRSERAPTRGGAAQVASETVLAPPEQTLARSDASERELLPQRLPVSEPAHSAHAPETAGLAVITGRVVDPQGQALPGVQLELVVLGPWPASEEDPDSSPDPGDRVTYTGVDGSFVLRVRATDRPLALDAWLAEHTARTRTRCKAGDTGLILVMDPNATLRGSVVLDPAFSARELAVVLLRRTTSSLDWNGSAALPPPDDAERFNTIGRPGSSIEQLTVDATGRFEARGIMPGIWDLTLITRNGPAELRHDGIALAAGQVLALAPLSPSDWRRVELSVVDEQHRPLPGATVAFRQCNRPGWSATELRPRPGAYAILRDERSLNLGVACEGFEPRWLTGVLEDRELVLRRGIELQLSLRAESALADGEYSVALDFQALGVEIPECLPNANSFRVPFGEPSRISAFAPFAGRYRMSWMAVRRSANGLRCQPIPELEPVYVEILGDAGPQRIELSPPPDLLDQARRLLGPD